MIIPQDLLFLFGILIPKEVESTNGTFSEADYVVNITKDTMASLAFHNKSSFILFFSER